jgi:acyl carrier protein
MSDDTKKIIIDTLSEHLGVEPDDINDDDSFEEDLNMRAVEISDFIQALNTKGIETDKVDLKEIETVTDLIYALEN